MSKSVDFYYDYVSPTAYLAWTQLTRLCTEAGATLNYKPMLLGGVFKATGNSPPVQVAGKGAWLRDDIIRHANYYDVPFAMNPHFPLSTLTIMRGAMWALATGHIVPYNQAMFEAVWVYQKNMADKKIIAEVLEAAGFDSEPILAAAGQPEIKKALIEATGTAVKQGVFGAPTMFVDGEMHFGQDRIDWVRRALSG